MSVWHGTKVRRPTQEEEEANVMMSIEAIRSNQREKCTPERVPKNEFHDETKEISTTFDWQR